MATACASLRRIAFEKHSLAARITNNVQKICPSVPLLRCMSSGHWGTSGKTLQVIDCHAGGEPARVVVGGLPTVPGKNMREKRIHMAAHMDHYRQLLIQEPRGYPCQNVDFILPPVHPEASYGFVIAEQNKVYPLMSGHNTMCVVTTLLETGMIPMIEPLTEFALEAPVGLIRVSARCEGGKVIKITFTNQPAFIRPEDMNVVVDVPHFGKVEVDIAFGGMHYAIVDVEKVGLTIDATKGKEICRLGEMIKVAAREQHPVQHPEIDYPGCDILAFREPAKRGADGVLRGKNAVVMSNTDLDWNRPETWTAMIDRSPCGGGTCAIMALLHARGELEIGEDFVHEGIVGSKFVGRLIEETVIGSCAAKTKAVIPTVSGRAWITQHCTVVVDPSDPFQTGFSVGDIW